MNIKTGVLALALMVVAGCAQYGRGKAPTQSDDSAPLTGATSSGASSTAGQQAAAGPRVRTREEVHAEAVQAVKNYKSTQDEERDWFNPFARP